MCNAFGYLIDGGARTIMQALNQPPVRETAAKIMLARPTDLVPVIRYVPVTESVFSFDQGAKLRWGLRPHWFIEGKHSRTLNTNARSESIAEKPSFRDPYRSRRCIVRMAEYYEGSLKAPHTFRPAGGLTHFLVAGLWDSWTDGVTTFDSFAIVTTAPNSVVFPVHDRMPLILGPVNSELWLDPKAKQSALDKLLQPLPDKYIEYIPPPHTGQLPITEVS